jgi:uncharacterized tellurite resistance protein B-like protein
MTDLSQTTLDQIIRINERGNIANAVNFGMMTDPDQNLALCESFVFNYNAKKPEQSSVGLLDIIRESFHSNNTPNIHLIVQQFGKGKSHFAVTAANFFSQPHDSNEVAGILQQIENATSGHTGIFERLKHFKTDRRYLTLCLSGDRDGDLRKLILNTLLENLEREGIEDSIGHQICRAPLHYLEQLDENNRHKADRYLAEHGNPDGDLEAIIDALKNNETQFVRAAKDIAKHITGLVPDFQADIDVTSLLEDALDRLCGDDDSKPFRGILILFDELPYYLRLWSSDPISAGHNALQSITNLCERHRSKIALVSFAQTRLNDVFTSGQKEDYRKLTSRLEIPNCTYEPESSLELVFANLILQEPGELWMWLQEHYRNTLRHECRTAFEKRIPDRQAWGGTLTGFYETFGLGCYPLHPLTTHLLAKLDFAGYQDRTAIAFIKNKLGEFIAQTPIECDGRLSFLPPIAIVDFFKGNLGSELLYYESYAKAERAIAGSDDPTLLPTLQALFLFYAASGRIQKSDREAHEPILAELSGLSEAQVKAALKQLKDSVYYREASKLYSFYSGTKTPNELKADLENAVRDSRIGVRELAQALQDRIGQTPDLHRLNAPKFVHDHQLVNEDWQFQRWAYSIEELRRLLDSQKSFDHIERDLADLAKRRWENTKSRGRTDTKGIFAYVIDASQDNLNTLYDELHDQLKRSKNGQRFVIAIPTRGVEGALLELKRQNVLKQLPSTEKQLYGETYTQLMKQVSEDLDRYCQQCISNLTYHSLSNHGESESPEHHASALLKQLYPDVPPSVDKLRSNLSSGTKIVKVISTELLKGQTIDATIFPDQSYNNAINSAFVQHWKLFQKHRTSYQLQKPKHPAIQRAWGLFDRKTALGDRSTSITALKDLWQELSQPPYGYNELNFTVITCAWLSYHANEVNLRGASSLPKRGQNQSVIERDLKQWVHSDILEKASDFVEKWIEKHDAVIIRRASVALPEIPDLPIDFDTAQCYLQEVDVHLDNPDLPEHSRETLRLDRETVDVPYQQIKTWYAPVKRFEGMNLTPDTVTAAHLDALLDLRPHFDRDLPPRPFGTGELYIEPTPAQRDRDREVRETIGDCINRAFEDFCERAEAIVNESDYYDFADRARDLKAKVETLGKDFAVWTESLDYAVQTAKQRREKLKQTPQPPIKPPINPPTQPPQPSVVPSTPPLPLPPSLEDWLTSEIEAIMGRVRDDATQADYETFKTELQNLEAKAQLRNLQTDSEAEFTDELRDRLAQSIAKIDQAERTLSSRLSTWRQEIETLTTHKGVGVLLSNVARQEKRYTQPEAHQAITHLKADLNALLDFPFTRVDGLKTLNDIDHELDKLQRWHGEHGGDRPTLEGHFAQLNQKLDERRDHIARRLQDNARNWLQDLETYVQKMFQMTSDEERFKATVKLLEQQKVGRLQHLSHLTEEEVNKLEHIVNILRKEQNKYSIKQIELKFKKLPKVQRNELYERLAQYLDLPD